MEVRRRNKRTVSPKNGSPVKHHGTKAAAIDRTFTRCILGTLVVLVLLAAPVLFLAHLPSGLRFQVEKVMHQLGIETRAHVVVLDAGSTGSRVLAFSFRRDLLDGGQLKLEDELWMQVKPGLSAHKEAPEKAGQSITQLVSAAKERIPPEYWSTTPITLKATAGLRLLPAAQSEAILNEVKKVLVQSGFQPAENLIEIMNPMEEGMYAWFTVNFLLDEFAPGRPVWKSSACLDLGGGSTQITYAPEQVPVKGTEGRKHFMHTVDVLGKLTEVYSHSYLGLGLMTARESIFTRGFPEGQTKVESACMASKNPQKFSFHGQDYVISGKEPSYESCLKVVQAVIKENNVHRPNELKDRHVAAFSYFYDLALDAGLIGTDPHQGVTTLREYVNAARAACKPTQEDSFACVDLTFTATLMSQGYGFPMGKEIRLYKKINGHEASWALGVGYSLVD